jgi:hypothetical protein
MATAIDDMVTIIGDDEKPIIVRKIDACQCGLIKGMIEEVHDETGAIPIKVFPAHLITLAMRFCALLSENEGHWTTFNGPDTVYEPWQDAFLASMGNVAAMDLFPVASYLNIQQLIDLTACAIARQLRGLNLDEMRVVMRCEKTHGFTAEEDEENRKLIAFLQGIK